MPDQPAVAPRPAGAPRPAVVLVGPPGSGKSTVGRALARQLGVPLRDTDADIEASAGRPIPEIFIDEGEAHFRELERLAVVAALGEHTGVLALGGGAILSSATREALLGHTVVFLNLSMPVGVRRTGMSTNRPLLTGVNPRATYKAMLDARLVLYREVSALEVDTDHLTASQVATQIISALNLPSAPADHRHR